MLKDAQKHAEAFHKQIHALISAEDNAKMKERKNAAVNYFTEKVLNPCIAETDEHIASLGTLAKVAKQVKVWKDLNTQIQLKLTEIKSTLLQF
jgi:hypothetical protein